MSINNKDAVRLVEVIKCFCENTSCNVCCFADDTDGHCLLTDNTPCELDIDTFMKQAEDLIE